MRKLRKAEQRVLEAFPPDVETYSGHVFKGTLRGCRDWPKHASIATIRNLFDLGLIEHASIDFYSCPIRLTEKGKNHIARPVQKKDEIGC